MPITATNPFKGRQYSGEVILQAVRLWLAKIGFGLNLHGIFSDRTHVCFGC
jgi:hypothetical protein